MYNVGDKFTLKRDHGLLKKGETVTVVEVQDKWNGYFWLRVMSAERYGYDGWMSIKNGEDKNA